MVTTRAHDDDPKGKAVDTEEQEPLWFTRFREANDQRLSRLVAMCAEMCASMKQTNQRSDDQSTVDRSGSDHFERSRGDRRTEESPEDQALDDEKFVETEVATELIGIEEGTVKREANAEANSDVISAIVKEESTPQFLMVTEADSTCVQHTNVILQQVSISPLEHSLNFCKANLNVKGNCQYAMGKTHQIWSDSNFGCVNDDACQVFDLIPMRTKVLPKEHKERFHKSWRFKFKHRVAPRDSKSVSDVLRTTLGPSSMLKMLLDAGRKRNQGLFIRLHNNLKQQRCPKSWMFKFKTDSKSARTNHILHQEKKPSKSPKSWKFKFKSENLKKVGVLFQHSHGLSNRLHRQDLQDLQQFITFGEVTLQLEHKWKFKGKGKELREELCHTSRETIQEGSSHCFLLVAAAYLTIPMQFGSEGSHVWHRWKARYSQNFDRVWDPGVSSFFITLRSRFLEGEGFDIGNEMKRVAREKEISCWTRGRS